MRQRNTRSTQKDRTEWAFGRQCPFRFLARGGLLQGRGRFGRAFVWLVCFVVAPLESQLG